jgi:hypothetical protein
VFFAIISIQSSLDKMAADIAEIKKTSTNTQSIPSGQGVNASVPDSIRLR